MIKNAIFLLPLPLSVQDPARYDFETLRAAGYRVAVWDLSKWLYAREAEAIASPRTSGVDTVQITDGTHFRKLLRLRSKDSVFFDFVKSHHDLDWASEPLYRALGREEAKIFSIDLGVAPTMIDPSVGGAEVRRSYLLQRFKELRSPKVTLNLALAKGSTFLRAHGLFYPKPIRLFGTDSPVIQRILNRFRMNRDQFIPIHSLDYDRYLKATRAGNIPRLVKGKYALFLWPNHAYSPDIAVYKIHVQDRLPSYHAKMNRLFEQIEKELGLEVVICVHPRSYRTGQSHPFGSRKVFGGQTLELTAHCSLMITHGSTAMNFAVLFAKPILFALTDENLAFDPHTGHVSGAMAKVTGSQWVNLDQNNPDFKTLLKSESELRQQYTEYRRNFSLTETAKDLTSYEIIVRELGRLQA